MTHQAVVIGCGRMGAFTSEAVRRWAPDCWFPLAHAEAITANPSLRLVALCDPSAEQLRRAEAAYGDPRGFSDALVLADEVRPELASIATRTVGRAEIIEALYSAGTRAFHIEKPLCNSVAELERLEVILSRPDVFATLGTVRRHFPIYRAARERAASLGALLETRADFGPGSLYWVHPHTVDLALFAAAGVPVASVHARLGEVESSADGHVVLNDPIVQAATIWFENGLAGHIGRAPGLDFVFAGERGTVTVVGDGRELSIAEQAGENPYPARVAGECWDGDPTRHGSAGPISHLVACLAGDQVAQAENSVIKRDMVTGQRVLFAMVESHRKGGTAVALDAIDPDLSIMARTGGNFA